MYIVIRKCVNLPEQCVTIVVKCIDKIYRISGVMGSVLASSVVDHGFEPRSGQTKDYKIGIC